MVAKFLFLRYNVENENWKDGLSMTTLYEGAFAKLNLTLDVLGKREDGYHDLQSVMQGISIRDDIEIDVGTGKPG